MGRLAIFTLVGLTFGASIAQAKDTKFWNLTQNKIVSLQLSPVGKGIWGKNQTDNDNDHSVDPDERLKITDIKSGNYDVRFKDATGNVCLVKNVAVTEGEIFSIEDDALTDCNKK